MKKIIKNVIGTLVIASTLIPVNTFALTKEEIVFTTLDNNGEVKENIVNTHLKYVSKDKQEDETILKEILNISGKEKYEREGNILTWKTEDKDITYQGKTDKENPIKVDIKYYLNDEEMPKSKILGKKGQVKIVINFTNNLYNNEYKMHTPFVVTTMSIIKSDKNSNFEITNGKVVNTGTKNVLAAISTPGLYEDLSLEDLKNMDSVTITYDTDKFTDDTLYFVATPKVLEKADLNLFNKLDGLNESMKKLQNGMNELAQGSEKLEKGTSNLNEGSKKLSDGLYQALDGTNTLEEGLTTVDENLKQIIAGLDQGIDGIKEKQNELGTKLNEINTLKQNNENTIEKLKEANTTIYNGVKMQTQALGGLDITSEAYKETLDTLLSNSLIDETTYKTLMTYKTEYDSNIGLITLISYNNGALDQLTTTLSSTSGEVETKLNTINGYLKQLQQEGTSKTKDGASSLKNGITELYNGSVELTNGTKILMDGTTTLKNGINKINGEGISKLTGLTDQASTYSTKAKRLVELSKNYKGYASENANDVIFVYKVD